MRAPLVSVIIPTYRCAKTLDQTLFSIGLQTYENIEIIVTDSYSDDGTIEIAKAHHAKILLLPDAERSEAINEASKLAKGEYLYRIDGDCVAEPTLIEEAVRQKCDAVIIHSTTHPSLGGWAKIRKLERDMYFGDPTHVAARFFRTKVFLGLGGFDESLVAGEDFDLHNRILANGWRIGQIDAREYDLGEPTTLREFALKNVYYGKTIPTFIRANRGRGLIQIQPFRGAFIHHRKSFLVSPQNFFGTLILQYVRYASGIIGWLSTL